MDYTTRQIIEAVSNASSKEVKQAFEEFLGEPGVTDTRCFGTIPTDMVEIIAPEGKITKISWWSGLNWSARRGRGTPDVEVAL